MATSARFSKFTAEKGKKKPKSINEENKAYVLYAPETIKMNAGDFRYVVMNFAVDITKDIMGTFLIVPSLKLEGGCGDKIRFELFNKNHSRKIDVKNSEKLALFMIISEGTERFQTRYETF